MDFRGQTEPRNLMIAGVVSDGHAPLSRKEEGALPLGLYPSIVGGTADFNKIRPRQSLISLSGIVFWC